MRLLAPALVLAALALTGCETSAEKSAKLEKVAKLKAREVALHRPRGLSITRQSRVVKVTSTTLLHSSEGTAAVVTLANTSATALRNVPIEITVRDAHGATLYANTTPGLASSLVSVPLIAAHASTTWVDDQVQAAGAPASIAAKIGEGEHVSGAIPQLSVDGAQLLEGQAEASVVNHSHVEQRELVVYALARRGGKIVAAGRALVPQVGAGASAHVQVFFIGTPQGAQLQFNAPASTVSAGAGAA